MLSQPFGSGGLTVSSSVVESQETDIVNQLIAAEEQVFLRRQPRSTELIAQAREHLAGGATPNWQIAEPQAVWMSHGSGSKVYDVPALADRALPAARAYADIAPSVPHALHMPSHTFTRTGLWKESVATNIKSAAEAEKTGGVGEALHAMDYQTYAYLQMAMDAQAKGVLDHAMTAASNATPANNATGAAGANSFALAAIPARYAMERQQWSDAMALSVRPAPTTPYTEAITHFARAIGAARAGKPADAAADIARLAAIRDRELELKDAYWAEQVDIQRRAAEAWVAYANGQKDEALKLMAAAADAEDLTDKSAVTPGPLAPARELYGYMLLDAGRAKDALTAFEKVTKKEPNRFLALYGAGKAAEAAKQPVKAKGYYRQIVTICKDAAPDRAELVYARKMAK